MLAAGIDNAYFGPTDTVGVGRQKGWGLGGARASRERHSSVVVVDERQLIVDALTALLANSGRFTVTASTTDHIDPAAIAAISPDLVLVGVGEAHEHQLRLIAALHRLAPAVRTVIIADSQDAELLRCVLDQGVAALVLTDATGEDLALTLDQVVRGHTALPAGWQGILAESDRDPIAALSGRQLEVLTLLADGCTYEEISARLIISVNTVKFHVRSIYVRLGVSSRMAAAKVLEAGHPRHTHPVSLERDRRNR